MISKPICPYLLIIIISVVLSCSTEKQEAVPTQPIIKDTILNTDTVRKVPEEKPDFTGKYSLLSDNFRPVYFQYVLSLIQVGDSVFGDYEMTLYYNKKELIGHLRGDVSGDIRAYNENSRYDASLNIIVTERQLDSTKLSYEHVQFFVDKYFAGDVSFNVTYSKEKNTIEHNYAGGEWDTWQKLE